MMTGTCDICDARDVELSRSNTFGIETWSCYGGCPPARLRLRDELRRDMQRAIETGRMFDNFIKTMERR